MSSAYPKHILAFMSFKDGTTYTNINHFTPQVITKMKIRPQDIVNWLNMRAYGTVDPGPDDYPTEARYNSLTVYRGAIASLFGLDEWDEKKKKGSPVRCDAVRDMLKRVKALEASGKGKKEGPTKHNKPSSAKKQKNKSSLTPTNGKKRKRKSVDRFADAVPPEAPRPSTSASRGSRKAKRQANAMMQAQAWEENGFMDGKKRVRLERVADSQHGSLVSNLEYSATFREDAGEEKKDDQTPKGPEPYEVLKDPNPYYVEEEAHLYHNPPLPSSVTEGVYPKDLQKIPPPPPMPDEFPNTGACTWSFDQDSRILLAKFKTGQPMDPVDEAFLLQMFERNDVTVISEGLLDKSKMDPTKWSLQYLQHVLGEEYFHKFRQFDTTNGGVCIEQDGLLSMTVKHYVEYLHQRQTFLQWQQSHANDNDEKPVSRDQHDEQVATRKAQEEMRQAAIRARQLAKLLAAQRAQEKRLAEAAAARRAEEERQLAEARAAATIEDNEPNRDDDTEHTDNNNREARLQNGLRVIVNGTKVMVDSGNEKGDDDDDETETSCGEDDEKSSEHDDDDDEKVKETKKTNFRESKVIDVEHANDMEGPKRLNGHVRIKQGEDEDEDEEDGGADESQFEDAQSESQFEDAPPVDETTTTTATTTIVKEKEEEETSAAQSHGEATNQEEAPPGSEEDTKAAAEVLADLFAVSPTAAASSTKDAQDEEGNEEKKGQGNDTTIITTAATEAMNGTTKDTSAGEAPASLENEEADSVMKDAPCKDTDTGAAAEQDTNHQTEDQVAHVPDVEPLPPIEKKPNDPWFTFVDHLGREQTVHVGISAIYMIDFDMHKLSPLLWSNFMECFQYPEILPGGDHCMMNSVTANARPFMGPNMYITPPATFTHFHQDGHGTVDSGHLCVKGYNEVIMLRRLTERHKKHALWILTGDAADEEKADPAYFDGLYQEPHGDELGRKPAWPTKEQIEECKKMGYCPTVCIVKPGQLIHINKGRLHAFRKMSTEPLPETDCHYDLREQVKAQKNLKPGQEEMCISVAWDWMYRGSTAEGIHREVCTVLEATILNRKYGKVSLAIPELSLLQMARVCPPVTKMEVEEEKEKSQPSSAEEVDRLFDPDEEDAKPAAPQKPCRTSSIDICRGILPGLEHVVKQHLGVFNSVTPDKRLSEERGVRVRIADRPNSNEDPAIFGVDPYGNSDFMCKLCSKELSNTYYHCDGCEILLSKDFNICQECHEGKLFLMKVQMHPLNDKRHSTINHTGSFSYNRQARCPCKNGPCCRECGYCAGCSCRCHTWFTLHSRFFDQKAEEALLKRVQDAVPLEQRVDPKDLIKERFALAAKDFGDKILK